MSNAYRSAGVDQHAADALVSTFAALAARTKQGASGVGGFAGGISLDFLNKRGYANPGLVMSTDGVGTKVELLQRAGRHHTAGWDAVAMNADDVVCCGAEPLMFVDYVSVNRLDGEVVTEIVTGVADGCVAAGCALVGGETSQHPGLLPEGGYDVVGTCVGVVDLDAAWGPDRVREGDCIVGLASSGPHSNGYALIRKLLGNETPPDFLLAPTEIYSSHLLTLGRSVEVHAAAHITGGGIVGNLSRALPDGAGARIDDGSWESGPAFEWITDRGVGLSDLRATFNCGLGMMVICPDGEAAVRCLEAEGVHSWVVGAVTASGEMEWEQPA